MGEIVNKPRDLSAVSMDTRRRKAGAREELTHDLALRITRMIELFPDAKIRVSWDNVIKQVKLRFCHNFQRNVLSQKSWDGRKLIAEAFHEAKEVQRRQEKDLALKYTNEPRSRLRLVIAKLQAENLALRDQLAAIRAAQYDEIYSLLDVRTPLHRAVALRAKGDTDSYTVPASGSE